jgi:hypothetical protein
MERVSEERVRLTDEVDLLRIKYLAENMHQWSPADCDDAVSQIYNDARVALGDDAEVLAAALYALTGVAQSVSVDHATGIWTVEFAVPASPEFPPSLDAPPHVPIDIYDGSWTQLYPVA